MLQTQKLVIFQIQLAGFADCAKRMIFLARLFIYLILCHAATLCNDGYYWIITLSGHGGRGYQGRTFIRLRIDTH